MKACFERIPARDERLLQRSGAFYEALHELDRSALFDSLAEWLEPRMEPV